jgi:hypothetical protein
LDPNTHSIPVEEFVDASSFDQFQLRLVPVIKATLSEYQAAA